MVIRTIDVRERVMARNDELAGEVRARLSEAGVPALNLVSSPGSGKTSLLERTLKALGGEISLAMVTGDVQTRNDAERLARLTTATVQAVVTGGGCHLDARQILTALEDIPLSETDLIFIENVGNLVCPASWDLGETAKVVLFSVTEGEDKPVKYPKMFRESRVAVLTKVDLLPHVPFQIQSALSYLQSVNPAIRVFLTSALTGEGLDEWYGFIRDLARQGAPIA
jgi:hydrogenase nickel incorporation protein HypB